MSGHWEKCQTCEKNVKILMAPSGLAEWSPTQLPKMSKHVKHVKHVETYQNSDGTLRSGRVVPHPAPRNIKTHIRIDPEMLPRQK